VNSPSPELEKLAAAIDRDPGDSDAWQAYGEALSAAGDVRGDLIALELAGGSKRCRQIQMANEEEWLGPRISEWIAEYPEDLDFVWRYGFVREARVKVWDRSLPFPAFLGSSAARFVERLTFSGGSSFQLAWRQLAKRQRPTLRHVSVEGRERRYRVDRVLTVAPNLQSLIISGDDCSMNMAQHFALNSFSIAADHFEGLLPPLLESDFPRLERLHLRFREEYSSDALMPLLQEPTFPSLRRLEMTFCFFANKLLAALSQSPLLRQLRVLDLSHGQLTAGGAKTLLEHAGAFAHLDSLKLDRNLIDTDSAARIREALPQASVDDQR